MKVIKLVERKDGSATMTYEINKKEEAMFRKLAKDKKRTFCKRFINEEVMKALQANIDKEVE